MVSLDSTPLIFVPEPLGFVVVLGKKLCLPSEVVVYEVTTFRFDHIPGYKIKHPF